MAGRLQNQVLSCLDSDPYSSLLACRRLRCEAGLAPIGPEEARPAAIAFSCELCELKARVRQGLKNEDYPWSELCLRAILIKRREPPA